MGVRELFELTDRVAVVTGGARGIGRTVAEGLAEMGADVALIDVHEENLKAAREDIRRLGRRVMTYACDVTNATAVEQTFAAIEKDLGRVDVLFNSAGICFWKNAEEITEAEWDNLMAINLKGTFLCCQAAARRMIPRGKGAIVNVASMSATIVNQPQNQCAYNTSKAGVVHLTKSLAAEWARHNVRVNAVSPGYTATEMTLNAPVPEYRQVWEEATPMKRMARPDEITAAVVYLASDASSFTTGADLIIDGGFVAW